MSKNTLRVKPSVRILRPRKIDVISGPKVICEVKVISPDGKVKSSSRTEKPLPDLILVQFKDWLSMLLAVRSNNASAFYTYQDVTNTTQTLYHRGNGNFGSSGYYLELDNALGYVGGSLAIGADPTAAQRTDYELTSKTAEFEITAELTTDSTIIKQGAWLATGAGTVYETGYYLYLMNSTGTSCQFLIFHDIPTPQAYILNDSVQVTYTIQL